MQIDHKIILAIDFDETIVNSDYPKILGLRKNAKKVINNLAQQGCYIIIWTCRSGKSVLMVEQFLKDNNIHFDLINEHHDTLIKRYNNDTRKVSADVYIDDKCIAGLPSWNIIQKKVDKILHKVIAGEFKSIL